MSSADFWNDKEEANYVISQANDLKRIVEPVLELDSSIKNNVSMLEMLDNNEVDLLEVIKDEYYTDKLKLEELELETYQYNIHPL